MQSVHHILVFERARSGLVHILRPGRSANDDHSIRIIFPDDLNYGVGVFFDVIPLVIAIWFIADLVDHILGFLVLLRDVFKKCLRFFFMHVRVVIT